MLNWNNNPRHQIAIKLTKIKKLSNKRIPIGKLKTKNRLKIIRNVRELQFEYRGRDIVLKTLQLDLGDIIARLNPIFSLKL